jgi:hypothetical protein
MTTLREGHQLETCKAKEYDVGTLKKGKYGENYGKELCS